MQLDAQTTATNISSPENQSTISLVVPVFNDAENVPLMVEEASRVFTEYNKLAKRTYIHEIIFVNDGSRDNSWEAIEMMSTKYAHVRGICLSRNFGHMCAIKAGFDAAQGDVVVTMDSDLEDPPSLIPKMLVLWEEGHQVVRAQRVYRMERPWIKRKTSDWFYWVFNKVSDVRLETGTSEFRLLDRQVVEAMREFSERNLFHRGLVEWLGFKSVTLPYEKGERITGVTSYNFKRMFALAWSGIVSFSTFPLWSIVALGVFITSFSGALLILMATMRWVLESVIFTDIAFLVVFTIFANGLTLFAVGVLAMYLAKMYTEIQRRPHYVVWKKTNF